MLHGLCFGEEPEHDTVCFLFKVSAGGEERYLVCAAGVFHGELFLLFVLQRSFHARIVPPICFATL